LSPIRQALFGSDSVAPMSTSFPAGFEEIRREELARAFQKVLRLRYVVQPVLIAMVLYIVIVDPSVVRRVLLLVLPAVAVAFTAVGTVRMRRLGISRFRISRGDLIAIAVVIPVGGVVTGGTRSPLLMQVLPMLVIMTMLHGARPARIVLVSFLVLVWTL